MTTATYSVDGMTCAHCVHHVTSELTALPGVSDVQIELVVGGSSPVTVTSDAPLDESAVAAAVAEAGYALTPKRSLL
jgi:copper chaperone CopZ